MKTYKITGKTNGYIAQRDIHFNGNTYITLAEGLTLKEAQQWLLDFYNEKYDSEIGLHRPNWGLVRCNDPLRTTSRPDGTRSFEYDSRIYSIEEYELVKPEEIHFNFNGAFLMWQDEETKDKFFAHLGNEWMEQLEKIRPIFAEALTLHHNDNDPIDAIEEHLEEHGFPLPLELVLG